LRFYYLIKFKFSVIIFSTLVKSLTDLVAETSMACAWRSSLPRTRAI